MEEKLSYLREYNPGVRMVSSKELTDIEAALIPDVWRDIFKEANTNKRKEAILKVWKNSVATELRNTISYLADYLEEVELLECGNVYSVLYTIRNPDGGIFYYEGRNPQDDMNNSELEKHWDKLPRSLRHFYGHVHNGFYYYASESMGLVPFESVTYLGDDDLEWSILEELKEPLQLDLTASFGFFTNGMGSYIVIDAANCGENEGVFWSAKRQPKYHIDFWSYVDEWTVIGFQS
ncbi:SMI1/KNR4 family protein [Paenibacillus mesotrionivorans]|uniref:SMI1/KNR4 family protein n=1 Tax=Paenibacillus mesotrionivorans TaxID=3160968 RepID=A0ACC7P3A2_9BACL